MRFGRVFQPLPSVAPGIVSVSGTPDTKLLMPLNCQPPMIPLTIGFRSFRNFRSRPIGSS